VFSSIPKGFEAFLGRFAVLDQSRLFGWQRQINPYFTRVFRPQPVRPACLGLAKVNILNRYY
jgi:hypothetical protein